MPSLLLNIRFCDFSLRFNELTDHYPEIVKLMNYHGHIYHQMEPYSNQTSFMDSHPYVYPLFW